TARFPQCSPFHNLHNLSPAGRSSTTSRSRSIEAIESDWLAPMGSITGRSRSRRTQPSDFFRRKPPFKFEKRCQLSSAVTMNRFSIVAMHSNIAFDFVELKLDGVLHDG